MLRSANEWGTVYVVQCAVLYKIGYTNGPAHHRINALQTGNFSKITLVCEIPSQTPSILERHIHKQFAEKRVRGEWFRLTKQDVYGLKVQAAEAYRQMVAEQMRRAYEQAGWLEKMDAEYGIDSGK